MSEYCTTCGYPGSVDASHVVFAHSVMGVLKGECDRRDKIIRALRDIIASQRKSQQILELRREVGRLERKLASHRDVLVKLAAQASGTPGSTARADCMAAIAAVELRST